MGQDGRVATSDLPPGPPPPPPPPPQGGGWVPPGPPQDPQPQADDGVIALLGDLSIFVIPVIGGLVVYLVAGQTRPWLRQQSVSILNFQITMAIASLVSAILILVLIGLVLLLAVAIVSAVFAIIAAVNHGQSRPYNYPLAIPFVH
jgi:uncharacterized Tic20 family protein